ncbi:hypothetical protein CL614_10080 [archaeon]|nr:hypothetical protein [archaeon]|tara:strand:- start:711 stop:1439 length:729 start_codon:yes stop_codon:yes gene_type:complete
MSKDVHPMLRGHNDYDHREFKRNNSELFHQEWGSDDKRIDENAWIERYKHESDLVVNIIKDYNLKKVLEFGSGPGKMANMIQDKLQNDSNFEISYTMIDNPNAKKQFETRGYKGNFIVKNLSSFTDLEGLDDNYDLIITNDFLEHIPNPSYILLEAYKITTENAKLFVSVPNWRMGHSFIYRGLFDYDNFLYFLWSHGWSADQVSQSPLKCQFKPKLSSEQCLPDELIQSWNWYFECTKEIV